MTQILEVFANTGEVIERDRTEAEQAQFEADQTAAEQAEIEAAAATTANEEATAAAIAHAKSLGFTDDMIAVMYPNLRSESAIAS